MIKNWIQFNEAVDAEKEEVQSEVQKDVKAEVKVMTPNMRDHYKKFFAEKLKKHGATGIASLGDKRSAFFKEIKAEWSKHKEGLLKKDSE